MIQIEEGKTTSIISLVIIMIIVVFLIYSIFANPYGRVTSLLLPTLLFGLGFMMCYGDYLPFIPRGKQVNFDSGIAGTLRGALIHHTGGKATGMISIEKTLVPEKVIRERRVGGMHYLMDWMTMGNVTVFVTGEKWQWIDIPASQADNRNGAIRFVGNIRGELLPDPREMPLYMNLRNLTTINRHTLTNMQWIEHQAANIAAQKVMDMDSASQLFKEIADRAKNIRIMSRRGGSEDSIASELSSP